ncbi:energy-coupling factor ABC transporter ATP-binding protein [Aerococcus suis]|uniref:Energy-coupling factor transport system ATP-binding protein n=1 Tax=Aerococcus suis TaxID=371602 RepID=A0A1W1Z277_9LACT|nr:energy-coupling factor ABC transporter ATP-binding protein [Aerococcus suis]MDY4646386.1 energy-coupling factor ABC transporter ATP-binding protein [Aerococcus suis]SMC42560.1 energy-coupling factor transport system ATP-binding protein [Aerococcus suis]
MKNIIEVKGLNYRYSENNDQWAIKDLSLQIKRGEWLAIIGHNGSGKSTFSKLLVGLLEAQSGEIYVDHKLLSLDTVWDIRGKVGLVFQNPDNQFVGSTVEDDVAFGLENAGIPRPEMHERVEKALKQVAMWEYRDKEPAALSGGQKQRVAIAGILALGPEIIVLDESTAMLDPEGRAEVMAIIREVKETYGLTVISITHDLEEASAADRIVVFKEGHVVDDGKPADIFVNGEDLIQIGLGVPFTEQLKAALQRRQIDVPNEWLSEERLAEWLCK